MVADHRTEAEAEVLEFILELASVIYKDQRFSILHGVEEPERMAGVA